MAQTATITAYEYAAGTCTLRLVGELSPLSQVSGQPVLGRSRFTLQIHALSGGEGISGQGDRPAVLYECSGRAHQFVALRELVHDYVQASLNAKALGSNGVLSQSGHTLQPMGPMGHRLTVEAAPDLPQIPQISQIPQIIDLSTLQLADLADVLEQSEGELYLLSDEDLPSRQSMRPRRFPQLPLWVGSVAAVGIAALLGNQLISTQPSPVVLSPQEAPSSSDRASQADSQADDRADSGDRPFSLETSPPESAPSDAGAPATTGEALPAPLTTAPSTTPPSTTDQAPRSSPSPPGTPSPADPAPTYPPTAAARRGQPGPPSPGSVPPSTPAAEIESAPAATSPQSAGAPERSMAPAPEPAIAADSLFAPDWVMTFTRVLEQQWRPPANLAAPLRYSLTVQPNGAVTRLLPLNGFSAANQSLSTLPQPGTRLPDLTLEAATTVVVEFLPSGEVIVSLPEESLEEATP